MNNPWAHYNQSEEDRPLGSYGLLVTLFNALFAAFLLLARKTGRTIPERVGMGDMLLLGTATHKASRMLAKDAVISVVRAPFTTYQGPAGAGELNEAARGRGLQHALGELLTCPFCLGPWVASLFTYGLVLVPRLTRLVAGVFVMSALADFLQFSYDMTKQRSEQLEQENS